jgi:hypothetical protein
MRKAALLLALGLAAVLSFSSSASAQVATASIAGTVVDPTGLPVVQVEVVVINQGTRAEFRGRTSDLGAFRIPSLPAGMYTVRVSVDGFKTYVATDVKLDAGLEASLPPIQLELGDRTETVVVEAGTQLIATTRSDVSDTITKREFEDLPILNRNPLSLFYFQAGVNFSGRANTAVHGQRTSFTNITLDGVNIQDNFIRSNATDFVPVRLTISQVQELTVTGQNAGTDSGLGSSQLNFVTPSGTNEFHGDVFWYHRNQALAARNFFQNITGVDPATGKPRTPTPKFIQNQLGGSMGGPVFKDKLFFYGTYEAYRLRQETRKNTTVLSPNARQGIYTYIPTCTTSCPSGVTPGQPRTVNIFDAINTRFPGLGAAIDPFIAANILPRVPTEINNFLVGDSTSSLLRNTAGNQFIQRSNQDRDQYTVKIDYNPTQTHNFAGTYSWIRVLNDRTDLDGSFNTVPLTFTESAVPLLSTAWRWSPTGRFTNEARFGYVLGGVDFITKQNFGDFTLTGFLFTNPDPNFRPQGRATDTYTIQDNASYIWNNHTIRFGYLNQMIRVKAYSSFTIPRNYVIGFGNNTNFLVTSDFPGGALAADVSRANSLLASLWGRIASASEEFNVTSRDSGFVSGAPNVRNLRLTTHAFYANDSWRMSRRLTLNYGVRWDYIGRFDEANGLFLGPILRKDAPVNNIWPTQNYVVRSILDPNVVLDFIGGDSGRKVYNRDLNNWAPSIGLAIDPFGDGKTAIRMGYSINYVNDEGIRSADNAIGANAGLNTTTSLTLLNVRVSETLPTPPVPTVVVPRPLTLTNAQSGGLPQTVFTVDPNYRTPYVQQWNLTVQRDIGWNTVVDVKYIGNKGTSLSRGIDYNQVNTLNPAYFEDFLRARRNGFTNLANTGVFDPRCNFAGCEPLTFITNFASGGLLTNSTIRSAIQLGNAGELLSLYHFNNLTNGIQVVPNPVAGVADILENAGHSSYHAGVVEVRRRPVRGLALGGNYTFGKVLTNSDGVGQTNFDPYLDIYNPRLDRARALYDITHGFKAYYVYDLPFGRGRAWASGNSWINAIIGGWTSTSTFTWQSGAPISFVSNRGVVNRNARSTGKETANALVSHSELKKLLGTFKTSEGVFVINPNVRFTDNSASPDAQINECAAAAALGLIFCNPEPGQHGTLQRLGYSGPPVFQWDASLLKNIDITETVKLEYRAEFFNFTNRANFLAGDQNINATTFGRITSLWGSARITQMALRIKF